MTPFIYLNGGDHSLPEKDHIKGDHLIRPKTLKVIAYAKSDGHFNQKFGSDRGGHLSPPLFIEGVTSGTQVVTMPFITFGGHIKIQQFMGAPDHPLRWTK